MVLDLIDTKTFQTACNTDQGEILRDIIDTEPLGRLTVSLARSAKEFDRGIHPQINSLMCTDVCPCFHDKAWEIQDPHKYLSEYWVNQFGRTTKDISTDAELSPFVFSSDREASVESYFECLQNIESGKFKQEDGEVMVPEVNLPVFSLVADSVEHDIEYSFYKEIEYQYKCSGMCKPALFYLK